MLLFPADAGIDGHVLVRRPVVLREDRVVEGGGLEVEESKFPTILPQVDRNAAVGAFRHTRNIELCVIGVDATIRIEFPGASVAHLERGVCAIRGQGSQQDRITGESTGSGGVDWKTCTRT